MQLQTHGELTRLFTGFIYATSYILLGSAITSARASIDILKCMEIHVNN